MGFLKPYQGSCKINGLDCWKDRAAIQEKLGYTVDINLGNTDYKLSLAVYDKTVDKYILGIECDYAAYNSSDSLLERDVYRGSFLQSRGWKIIRVWSRDWWLNSSAVIKNIEREIAKEKDKIIKSKS